MSEQVRAAVREAIRTRGPITFAEYMELALYGAGGFYGRPPIGAEGDFVTSPHVHPVFGRFLAEAIRPLHTALGAPSPFRLVETGAGDGTLARQLLDGLGDLPVDYAAVEVSGGARAALATIPGVRVLDGLGDADLVLAHEVLDNLPFRVLRGEHEVRVGLQGDRLVETLADPDDALAPFVREGEQEVVVPTGAFGFVDEVAAALGDRGYALLIDYGDVGSAGGERHGYAGHRVVTDVLAAPGDADITSGVDFAIVAKHARTCGLVAFPTVSQHDALMALGFQGWFQERLAAQHAQLDTRDGMGAVRTWADKSRATLLADPGGLGRFRWLVLATPGLPAPQWLTSGPTAD
ncbi:MAG: SAM-dependent methyltransferase [Actinomycetota bacterium]